jgi:hypothetical protein
MYDSGVFYCAKVRQHFFQPYFSGNIDEHYKKELFSKRRAYLDRSGTGVRHWFFKASDNKHGVISSVRNRARILSSQEAFT